MRPSAVAVRFLAGTGIRLENMSSRRDWMVSQDLENEVRQYQQLFGDVKAEIA